MNRTRRNILASMLVALIVTLGYVLAAVPNVELMTIAVFISGYLLGARLGAMVGAASMALHSLFNPLGAALPPLMLAQMGAFVITALAGACCAPLLCAIRFRVAEIALAGLIGFTLTLLYDVATSVAAYFVAMDPDSTLRLWQFVSGGVAFMLMHLVWNTGLFLVVLPPALRILSGYRIELNGAG
jgi:hypothetical protein